MPFPPVERLAVQAHCLRSAMSADFEGTLARLHEMGFRRIELCSFAGCAGNPWGDFGDLAEWPPERVRDAVAAAGFDVVATHFMHKELAAGRLAAAIDWARRTGSPAIVLAGLPQDPDADLFAWRAAFATLNETGRRVTDAGLTFAYHTQIDVWRKLDERLLADELFEIVDADACLIELDPSGALVHGTDWPASIREHRGAFLAMHLRDGKRPPRPVPYLPALPLGTGDEDWDAAFNAAASAGIPDYILEMEVEQAGDVYAALATSIAFLRASAADERRETVTGTH